jgi:hypothetical protein
MVAARRRAARRWSRPGVERPGIGDGCGQASSPMSTEVAWCVKPPTLIRSTPARAATASCQRDVESYKRSPPVRVQTPARWGLIRVETPHPQEAESVSRDRMHPDWLSK